MNRFLFAGIFGEMITKKLAVPLINEKILQQAVHCYLAVSSISEEGFEFVRSRISPKCKMDIVTSLDDPTSPTVLWKILRQYQGRINLHIYTRNPLHANLFVFDLPFRKSVAFVGSGGLSMDGLKDSEELFWKITDAKEIESLMSWYTSYYQFGIPLTENIAREYELLYPRFMARAIRSIQEKRDFIRSAAFNLDSVRFRNQFFQRESFSVLTLENALADNAALRMSRAALAEKLLQLHSLMADQLSRLKLELSGEDARSADPAKHLDGKVDSMWLIYSAAEMKALTLRVGINSNEVVTSAVIGHDRMMAAQRQHFLQRLREPAAMKAFYQYAISLKGYSVEAGGKVRLVTSFKDDQDLLSFIDREEARVAEVVFARGMLPGDSGLSNDLIAATLAGELELLAKLI